MAWLSSGGVCEDVCRVHPHIRSAVVSDCDRGMEVHGAVKLGSYHLDSVLDAATLELGVYVDF